MASVGRRIVSSVAGASVLLCSMYYSSIVDANEQYVLVMSKDDAVCRHVLHSLNESVDKYGDIKREAMKEYNWVIWETGSYTLENIDLNEQQNKVEFTNIDINNDGVVETVVRETKQVHGMEGEQLLVFEENAPNFKEGASLTVEQYNGFSGVLVSPSWPYKLDVDNLLPGYETDKYVRNAVLGLTRINPMKIAGHVYLDIEETIQVKNQPHWLVIAKLKHEKFVISKRDSRKSLKLDYVCYFDKKLRVIGKQ